MMSHADDSDSVVEATCRGAISMPSHADDGAIETTWPHHDIDAE
jgi:hypothetical protein